MQIELITSVDELEGTSYYEFFPVIWNEQLWNITSVYIHDDVFSLIAKVFSNRNPSFAPFGVSQLSGSSISDVVRGLNDFAKIIGRAEKPENVWNGAEFEYELDQINDWNIAKKNICVMLHKFGRWMLSVKAQGQPTTILGM